MQVEPAALADQQLILLDQLKMRAEMAEMADQRLAAVVVPAARTAQETTAQRLAAADLAMRDLAVLLARLEIRLERAETEPNLTPHMVLAAVGAAEMPQTLVVERGVFTVAVAAAETGRQPMARVKQV